MFLNPIEFKCVYESLYFANVFFCILEINVINDTVFLHSSFLSDKKQKRTLLAIFFQNGCTLIGIWERVMNFPLISDFCQTKKLIYFSLWIDINRRSGSDGRAFSSTEGDWGSIPGRNIPKSFNNSWQLHCLMLGNINMCEFHGSSEMTIFTDMQYLWHAKEPSIPYGYMLCIG